MAPEQWTVGALIRTHRETKFRVIGAKLPSSAFAPSRCKSNIDSRTSSPYCRDIEGHFNTENEGPDIISSPYAGRGYNYTAYRHHLGGDRRRHRSDVTHTSTPVQEECIDSRTSRGGDYNCIDSRISK